MTDYTPHIDESIAALFTVRVGAEAVTLINAAKAVLHVLLENHTAAFDLDALHDRLTATHIGITDAEYLEVVRALARCGFIDPAGGLG